MDHDSNQSENTREVDAAPYAAALIEGHRDFGYCLETALADLVDNAITAGASKIELIAETAENDPWIALADNGCGMSEAELINAMRLGSKNPTDERPSHDLGRFGLGLKSASFSQCRMLTVITRKGDETCCARWDMDRVAQRNDWSLELPYPDDSLRGYDLLGQNGTVVVWQKLDRLSGGYSNDNQKRTALINSELTRAEDHLRLVFHRFMEGSNPKLKLYLNGRLVKPFDPMISSHPATQKDPEDLLELPNGDARIRCHTVPHHNRMTKAEWEEAGGPEGHLKTQGLYIYRENRLIIAGGWLGLARQSELTKLCRISVDIPNSMDSDWKIDVKKASAQLPPLVRDRLKLIVERLVGTSKRTYRSRGQKLVDETRFPIWNRVQKDGQIVFRPNIDHPVFRAYAEQLPDELREGFDRCMRILGSGLPIETLHAELVGNAEAVTADETSSDDLTELIRTLAFQLMESGTEAGDLIDVMKNYAFLRSQWSSVEPILVELLSETE